MQFVSPLFLFGLLLIGAPILIHLWKRQAARKIFLPSLALLLRSKKKVSRRARMRDVLLLLLRVLCIAMIPLALAQPRCSSQTPTSPSQAVALVLDTSFSMRYGTSFEAAKDQAEEILGDLGPKDAAVLFLSSEEEGEQAPSEDLSLVRSALRKATPSFDAAPLERALTLAAQSLAASPQPLRRVVVLTDATQNSFAQDALSLSWPEGSPKLEIIDVAAASLPNRAVTEVLTSPAPEVNPRAFRIEAKISNFSSVPVSELSVQVKLSQKIVAQGFVSLAPSETKTKSFYVTPESGGVLPGEVLIAQDELLADDSRAFLLAAPKEVNALIVNGDPKGVRYEDEAFFVEEALDATRDDTARVRYQTTTIEALSRQDLSGFHVVALLNVGTLGDSDLRTLKDFVTRGGGLFVSGGEQVAREQHSLDSLLPVTIRDIFVASDGAFSGGQAPRRFAPPEQPHPLFEGIDPTAPGGMGQAHFGTILLFDTIIPNETRKVVLSFDDGAPALVEGLLGQGRVLLFASTLDRSWTDLPVRPGFVPFVQGLFRYAGGALTQQNNAATIINEPRSFSMPGARIQRATLTLPDGEARELSLASVTEGSIKVSHLDTPGVWSLTVQTQNNQETKQEHFPVVLDPKESALRKIDPEKLRTLEEQSGDGLVDSTDPQSPTGLPLAHYLLAMIVIFILGEGVLIRRG